MKKQSPLRHFKPDNEKCIIMKRLLRRRLHCRSAFHKRIFFSSFLGYDVYTNEMLCDGAIYHSSISLVCKSAKEIDNKWQTMF